MLSQGLGPQLCCADADPTVLSFLCSVCVCIQTHLVCCLFLLNSKVCGSSRMKDMLGKEGIWNDSCCVV